MTGTEEKRPWHVLDVGSTWMREFASALSRIAPTTSWEPAMRKLGIFQNWQTPELLPNPPLTIQRFPLQRGYARAPLSWLVPFERRLLARLQAHSEDAAQIALICSTPYYTPLAELWPGPVVYYATDLTVAYANVNPTQVRQLDRRMCRAATAVCPNSRRIGGYFVEQAGCDPGKIVIVPNATPREQHRGATALRARTDARRHARAAPAHRRRHRQPGRQHGLAAARRRHPPHTPGNVGLRRTDLHAHRRPPATGRARLGPAECRLPRQQTLRPAAGLRTRLRRRRAPLPQARAHLLRQLHPLLRAPGACRPILATRGFAELLEKPPLLTLVDTAAELCDQLSHLASRGFSDGLETARWEASKCGTWEARAQAVVGSLAPRRDPHADASVDHTYSA